ncbi:sugar kinase [Sphingomonas fennica]|uniref:2-keto-3-deoxygluconate kinase n=1 Tax=Edaphosphingomonas fennica TaxID=114404 RepID=A0A2T4HRW9_9SPHN|nr:sugar kinase [Sphingomonas fennica]PTD18559.1 2-keto-3-deoxygluconate kinase [Sphingomonas fennica]
MASINRPGPVLCFGEMLLRLSATGRGLLLQEERLDARFGGAEANVAVALAKLGRPAAMATILPDNAIGDAAIDALRRHGVIIDGIARRDGRMGLYFLTPGAGVRASAIFYDRADSVFARARPGDFDWPALLAGAGRLHLSGITPALGPDSAELALEAVRAARAAGVPISFDGNYRARLWEAWDSDPRAILTELIRHADLLFGNHRDIALLLGRAFHGDGPERRREAALAAFAAFPNLRRIASTARHIEDADRHRLTARIDTPDAAFETAEIEVAGIIDRIGTGDAFAAGVLHSLADGEAAAAETGLALAALKHSIPGDFSLSGPRELAAFREGGRDVKR